MHALLDALIKEQGEPAALKAASPITYLHKGDPPFLLIQGDKDEYILFSEDTNLQAALAKVGVKRDIIRIPGGTDARAAGTRYGMCPTGNGRWFSG